MTKSDLLIEQFIKDLKLYGVVPKGIEHFLETLAEIRKEDYKKTKKAFDTMKKV